MTKNADKPKRRWRRPRWSMATMFVGITIVCLVFGLVVRPVEQRKRQIEALRSIKGTTIYYDFELDEDNYEDRIAFLLNPASPPGPEWLRDLIGVDYLADVVRIEIGGQDFRDDDLRRLRYMTKLTSLSLDRFNNITDRGAEDIASLPKLRGLALRSTNISDVGLEKLCSMTQLLRLTLWEPHLSNDGLKHLAKLSNLVHLELDLSLLSTLPSEIGELTELKFLNLSSNQLTTLSAAIGDLKELEYLNLSNSRLSTLPPEIARLTRLRNIDLTGNPITDVDLENLSGLKRLDYLDLFNTKVTKAGVASLRQALPKCSIGSDF